MALLQTIDLKRYFGETRAVDNVNLSIEEREFVSLVGPNGAGKTSLINVISALLPPIRQDPLSGRGHHARCR
jgi:ABC-type branched-subunit amino acid transport system ATPase component